MLRATDKNGTNRDQITWTWHGAATATADFLNPVTGSPDYRFCIYDSSPAAQPVLEAAVLPGTACGRGPCWKTTGKGYKFKDRTSTPDGTSRIKLVAGDQDRAQVTLKAKGPNLELPALPLQLPVTVQLVIRDDLRSDCWEATFTTARRNDAWRFKARNR